MPDSTNPSLGAPPQEFAAKDQQAVAAFFVADEWPKPKLQPKVFKDTVRALIANHSLIVGQSRSGKTNTARRLVEEIVRCTATRVVILDPNGDFRLIGEIADDNKDEGFATTWTSLQNQIRVLSQTGSAWGIRWSNLSVQEMAVFLNLSPSEDFAEYRHLQRHCDFEQSARKGEAEKSFTLDDFSNSEYFKNNSGEDVERYHLRLDQLAKVQLWWKPGVQDLDSAIEESKRITVIDLSMDDESVRLITAARVLEKLWRDGLIQRTKWLSKTATTWPGTLLLVDEAHAFAPSEDSGAQKQLVSERLQRFADQGKKLNLHLLVITQQPGKIHQNVLSEFTNRIVMRVNDQRSLATLENTFGGMSNRYNGALTFEPGEALVEGSMLIDEEPPPALPRGVRFELARTKEGGGSPPATWAEPRTETSAEMKPK